MLIFSYVIKHIIINKNKFLHYTLFAPYNKKGEKVSVSVFKLYIYHLRRYMIKFEVYFLLNFTSSMLKTRICIRFLYPIYSQSKKKDQKTYI